MLLSLRLNIILCAINLILFMLLHDWIHLFIAIVCAIGAWAASKIIRLENKNDNSE